jgi:hypothetical protein
MTPRTVDEVRAAARDTVAGLPPLSQNAADEVAAVLASRPAKPAAAA